MDMVLYHAACWDGFCAAWLCHKAWPDAEYVPVQYGQDPPDVTGKRVLIVDFSYKRDVMKSLCCKAKAITVLDHHKTARAELEGLDDDCRQQALCVPEITFDMDKSGGRLAWEFLYGNRLLPDEMLDRGRCGYALGVAPWLVDYTEDRDLWRHQLPQTREIVAGIRSFPLDFDLWDKWERESGWPFITKELLADDGVAIRRYEQTIINQHVRHAKEIELDGHKILAVNATVLFSDIAGTLAEGRPFGAAYFDRQDGKRQWSLRSRDEGIDVSEVAKNHGGGGHRNAAGFEETL